MSVGEWRQLCRSRCCPVVVRLPRHSRQACRASELSGPIAARETVALRDDAVSCKFGDVRTGRLAAAMLRLAPLRQLFSYSASRVSSQFSMICVPRAPELR